MRPTKARTPQTSEHHKNSSPERNNSNGKNRSLNGRDLLDPWYAIFSSDKSAGRPDKEECSCGKVANSMEKLPKTLQETLQCLRMETDTVIALMKHFLTQTSRLGKARFTETDLNNLTYVIEMLPGILLVLRGVRKDLGK